MQSNEQAIEAEQDPALTPRAWWRPNPERTKGVGLEDSIAVVRDVLKTRKFDVGISLRHLGKIKGLTKLSRVLWALGEGVYFAHRE